MLSAAQAILRQQALLESTGQPTLGPEPRLAPVVGDVGLQDSLRASTESKELEAEDDVSVDDDEPTVTAANNGDEMERVAKASPEDQGEQEAAGSEDEPPRPSEPQEETEDDPNNCDPQSNKWRGAEKDLKFSIEKILSPAFGNDFWAQFPFYRPEVDFLQLQSLAGNLQRLQQLHAEQAKLSAAAAAASAQSTAGHINHAAVAAAAAAGHGGHLQAMQSLATLQNCLKASIQQPHATALNGLNALHHVTGRQSSETLPGSALNNLQLSALQSMQQLQSLQLIQSRKSPESRKRRRSSDEPTSPARTPEVTSPQSGASTAATAARIERHEDSESQDTVADDSRLKSSEEGSNTGEEVVGVDKRGLWPAWVYCTRYSDRPSSGKWNTTRQVKTCFLEIVVCRVCFICRGSRASNNPRIYTSLWNYIAVSLGLICR